MLLATAAGGLLLSGCILRPTLTSAFSFRPIDMRADRIAPDAWGWREARLDTISRRDSSGALLAWWGEAADGASPCGGVLLLHGKGRNRAQMMPLGRSLQAAGFAVLLPDYRGYGGTDGTPSTAGVFDDAALSYRHLRERLGDSVTPIIVIGHSMGTALAARLARDNNPVATVYMSPFTGISSLVRARAGAIGPRLFDTTAFAFNPLSDASEVRGRALVVVAGRDLLIRKSESDAFIAGLTPAPAVLRDGRATHNGVVNSKSMMRAVTDSMRAWTGCSVDADWERGT